MQVALERLLLWSWGFNDDDFDDDYQDDVVFITRIALYLIFHQGGR